MITADELKAERAAADRRRDAKLREAKARRLLSGAWNATQQELLQLAVERWPLMNTSEIRELVEVARELQRTERPRHAAATERFRWQPPAPEPRRLKRAPAPRPVQVKMQEVEVQPDAEAADTKPAEPIAPDLEEEMPTAPALQPYSPADNPAVTAAIGDYLAVRSQRVSTAELREHLGATLRMDVPLGIVGAIRGKVVRAAARFDGGRSTKADRPAAAPEAAEGTPVQQEPQESAPTLIVGTLECTEEGFSDLQREALLFVGVVPAQLERAGELIHFVSRLPR